jgi:ubiquinone/menaquinone biosynthesis C-methylase UbiE
VPSPLTPPRRRGFEYLDLPDVEPGLAERSIGDVTVANRLFGGTRAVLAELDVVLGELGPAATLLDVGTGLGDIPARAAGRAARRGVRLQTVGVDASEELARASRARGGWSVCGDALRLPLASRSVDVVTCSQLLHHFTETDGARVVAELDRVARRRVIVSDLRRSYLAAAGFWAASWPLGFHPVTRHDGVVSVMRGFTARELHALVSDAVAATPVVRRRLGWRVTASWEPSGAHRPLGSAPRAGPGAAPASRSSSR